MKRLTVLTVINVLAIVALASVAANAQWAVTKSASLGGINGGNPYHTPPGTKISIGLSSTHTAEVENTSGGTVSGNVNIALRLYEEHTNQTHDTKIASTLGPVAFAPGDMFFVNGFFPSGVSGGQLTSNLSGAQDYATSVAHAFTHILVNSVGYNNDDTGGFQVVSP